MIPVPPARGPDSFSNLFTAPSHPRQQQQPLQPPARFQESTTTADPLPSNSPTRTTIADESETATASGVKSISTNSYAEVSGSSTASHDGQNYHLSPPLQSGDACGIEMTPLAPGTGHRRKRSSPINPATASGAASSGSSDHQDESKIFEEMEGQDRNGSIRTSGRRRNSDSSLSDEDLHDDEETGLTKSHRLRKRAKRRLNTTSDWRVVGETEGNDCVITDEEKKEADKSVIKRLFINASLILLWYIFSLSISIYNKWMFDSKQLDFHFPMFTTSIHMLVQFCLSCLVLYFIPSLRPGGGHRRKSDLGRSRHEPEAPSDKPVMTKYFYFTRIGPCGAATGLDIGLGNTSLKLITLTFYTMCKSSSLAFVLLFAFLFRLETPTWRLVAIIATMTAGVIMMVAGEVEFNLGGFILVISAAFFSGFRWGLTQILLLRNPATSNPFSSIFFLAPVMFVTLFLIAIPVEGFSDLFRGLQALAEAKGAVMAPFIILFPGAIAFLMTVSEFALLQRTSVVTLSIAGIFKEVVTISAAALVFGDSLTPINISGLLVTLAAICAYNYIKITKMRAEALDQAHRGHKAADSENAAHPSSSSSLYSPDNPGDTDFEGEAEDGLPLLRRASADVEATRQTFTAAATTTTLTDGEDVIISKPEIGRSKPG